MSVMAPAQPGRPYTVDDLEGMPDDGRRYEVVDGALLVTPAPSFEHQRAVARLLGLLAGACPAGLEVLPGPLEFVLAPDRSFQPDLVVVVAGIAGRRATEPPLLAVEVRSPSTDLVDRGLKCTAYAGAGIPSYWIADPAEPRLTAFALDGRTYREVASVAGGEPYDAESPFRVRIVPTMLAGPGP